MIFRVDESISVMEQQTNEIIEYCCKIQGVIALMQSDAIAKVEKMNKSDWWRDMMRKQESALATNGKIIDAWKIDISFVWL